MSSTGSSEVSALSQIRRFGLYRTIDARTEEFLKSSRRKQIRQGCACAAISTAITVTVVVVMLLLYEYFIAVERNAVQNNDYQRHDLVEDKPFADRLDRSYFGFDQEYFEQMPLLINSLQENNYVDPLLEMARPLNKRKYNKSIIKQTTPKAYSDQNSIRRTSPRPFFFEQRHPTPLPFSKTYKSKTWIERYRNEERLKNIRQLIKYLEKTVNAKVADMKTKPPSTQIAFTGVFVEPMIENKNIDFYNVDLQEQSSKHFDNFQLNHQSDILFKFKPDSPGDVNLLAEEFLRFSPIATASLVESSSKSPLFRQIPLQSRNCLGNKCEDNDKHNINSEQNNPNTDSPLLSTTKSFSVMLNLYPIKSTVAEEITVKPRKLYTPTPVDQIFLTTSRPIIQFKRKSNVAVRRIYPMYKRPRFYMPRKIIKSEVKEHIVDEKVKNETEGASGHMMVHVKVYSTPNKTDTKTQLSDQPALTTLVNPYISKAPIELSTSQIEDNNMGNSGYIPIGGYADPPELPKVLPFFEQITETVITSPPEILKFSHEDAKVPNQYVGLQKRIDEENTELFGRNIDEFINFQSKVNTLVGKLKNESQQFSTSDSHKNEDEKIENKDETSTLWTYVPQVNGHYRSINNSSKTDSDNLGQNKEADRKRRLEMSVSGYRSYVPLYKEIQRNGTNNSSSDE